jgi:hypothetical protein
MTGPIFIYNYEPPDLIGSIRLTAFIPARHLGARALYFGPRSNADEFLDRYNPSILIFIKPADSAPVRLAVAAAKRKIPIIATFCDFHFSDETGEVNRTLAELSTVTVVQTPYMKREIELRYGKPSVIIEDPLEYPRSAAQFSPQTPLKVLWFGHSSNFDGLIRSIPALKESGLGVIGLTIVSNQMPDLKRARISGDPSRLLFRFVPWSIASQYAELLECDAVFIPSLDDPSKYAKGHNRLTEAINAGRVAIVQPLPQYQELADYCFCDADYVASFKKALADPVGAVRRVQEGQKYIDSRFAPEVIAEKWRSLLNGSR